jgi:hypothetical protein
MRPIPDPTDSTPRELLQAVLTHSGQLQLRLRESLFYSPLPNAQASLMTFAQSVSGAVCAALDITLDDGESLTAEMVPLSEHEPAPEGLLLSMESCGDRLSVDMSPLIESTRCHALSFNVVHAFGHLMEGSVCSDLSVNDHARRERRRVKKSRGRAARERRWRH